MIDSWESSLKDPCSTTQVSITKNDATAVVGVPQPKILDYATVERKTKIV